MNIVKCAADLVWSPVFKKFPNLKIALSEGGIGWVNMLADRVDYVLEHSASGTESAAWNDARKPSEVLAESFWFCTIDDPGTLDGVLARFGPDHVMVEVDYPHADSTWPDTQELLHRRFAHLPDATVRKLTHENAEALFRWAAP
jgi:predicted TIM-barrel fold metal-dependent hydrolase